MPLRPLVVLRPEPGASATAAAARAAGLAPLCRPLFETRALPWTMPEAPCAAGLLTSAATIRHAGPGLAAWRPLPWLAVGAASAVAARAAGLTIERVGESDVAALLAVETRTLLHPGGRHRTPLPPDVRTVPIDVYEAVAIEPAPTLPDAGVFLLHSRRAAQRLAALVPADRRGGIDLVAISAAVLAAAGAGWRLGVAAARPADADLLAAAAPLCQSA